MYHATPASKWPSIRQEGLHPRGGWIYVSEDPESAKWFASDVLSGVGEHSLRPRKWALLYIDMQDLVVDDLERDPDSGERNYRMRISGTIPPSRIGLVEFFDALQV